SAWSTEVRSSIWCRSIRERWSCARTTTARSCCARATARLPAMRASTAIWSRAMIERHAARGSILVLVALFLLSTPARAYHTEEEHLTDDTAWTIAGDKTWRLGLFKFAVGLGDRVTLGTYTLPWFGATPNAYLKWRFYAGDTWNCAAPVGFFRLDTAAF